MKFQDPIYMEIPGSSAFKTLLIIWQIVIKHDLCGKYLLKKWYKLLYINIYKFTNKKRIHIFEKDYLAVYLNTLTNGNKGHMRSRDQRTSTERQPNSTGKANWASLLRLSSISHDAFVVFAIWRLRLAAVHLTSSHTATVSFRLRALRLLQVNNGGIGSRIIISRFCCFMLRRTGCSQGSLPRSAVSCS